MKAIYFEKVGKSRTFFIFDEESDTFKILAYFTIAIQVLRLPKKLLSGRKIKALDGFGSKINGELISEFPVILIGQFSKNDSYSKEINGEEIMQYCFATILEGQSKLGGRIVMLECKNQPYLLEFYKKYGFQVIDKNYEENELFQLVRVFNEEEIN